MPFGELWDGHLCKVMDHTGCLSVKGLAASLMVASLAPAQISIAPAPLAEYEGPTFTANTRLVLVHASVVDSRRRLMTNLPRSAFDVRENGVAQSLKVFRREDIPVSIGIMVDNSGSMREKRAQVAAAALEFVRASNPLDEVFIVNFDNHPYLDQAFTNDAKKLEQALRRAPSDGGTAMWDAAGMAMDYLVREGKKDKRVLVIITDGTDNHSRLKLAEVVRRAQQQDILIYCIGILGRARIPEARRALHQLATASGGMDYYPDSVREMRAITPRIANEIRNQYTLGYTPRNSVLDGTFRKIAVLVKTKGHFSVRGRNGYYATVGGK